MEYVLYTWEEDIRVYYLPPVVNYHLQQLPQSKRIGVVGL